MKKEFIPYKQALELKELGFDEPCLGYYYTLNGKDWKFAEKSEYYRLDDEINIGGKFSLQAPLYQQVFRWFREKYELDSEIYMNHEYGVKFYTYLVLKLEKSIVSHKSGYAVKQNTYEEAELECLKKLIEIVKKK